MQAKSVLLLVDVPRPAVGHVDWLFFRDALRQAVGAGVRVEMSALSQLTFVVHGDKTRVYDVGQQFDFQDFDLVVFKRIAKSLQLASAATAYCRKKSIPYVDTYIPKIDSSKLCGAFFLWEHDLPVPPTIYGPAEEVIRHITRRTIDLPVVTKDNQGRKGRNNFLVHDAQELAGLLGNKQIKFVVQPYIQNEGDYRVLVLHGRARLAILRRAAPGSHLNNTSQQATAQLIALADMRPDVLDLAQKAATVSKVQVAGVDIIVDKNTGQASILEVNSAPQLMDGTFADQKMVAYAEAIKELVGTS